MVISPNVLDHNPDYSGAFIDGIRIMGSAGINLQNLILDRMSRGDGPDQGAIEVVGVRAGLDSRLPGARRGTSRHRHPQLPQPRGSANASSSTAAHGPRARANPHREKQ